MIDSALPVQIGVAAALLGASAVTNLVGQAVYDPLSAVDKPYPLIEIGDDQIIVNADGVTDCAWASIHIWADGPGGRLAVKQIADAVRATLAPRPPGLPTLAVTGFAVVSTVQHMARYVVEDDPTDPTATIAHGNLQFRFQLAPTS